MSVASIEKKLDDIDVVLVEDDFSSAEEKEGKTLSLLENCCVCYTPLHQSRFPQLFPCLHSACSTCLSKQHVEENNLKSVECPSCKKLFPITEITENIIFKQSLPLSGGSDVFMCGGCEEPAVSGWCKDCGEFLCTDCVSAHSRVKLTRDHIIVPQELSAGSHPTQYCEAHREEPLKFYCMTCNQLTCRNCQLVDHRNHSYQMVAEAVSGLKEKLQALQGQVTKQKERVQQSQLDLDQRLQNIKDLKSSLKRKLSLVVAKMHRALLTKAVQLYQSTVAVYGREEKQLFHRKASLRRMEERQDYVMSFIERTLSVEGHAGVLLKNRIESQIKDILFQSVLPAHTMLEINVKVNQSIMTSVDNFGGISLRLVPFARNHSSQSESLLESVPILQNVPNDCIINRGTSSPDSSTQETLLGRSIVVPHSHSSSLSAPHDLPSASHTFHGTSSHTQNVPKDCIINAATSTTFLESCNQAALCGQCPTTHHSLSHNTQLGLPRSTPSLSASSYSNSLNTQPSLPQSTPALSSVPHSHPLSAQCSLPQSTLGLSSASHSHPLNAQCSLPKSTPGLSSVTHSHPPNAQPSLSQSTPGLSSVTYSHPLNSQCSLSQSTPGLSSVPHSHPLNSQCSLPQSTPGLSSVTYSHPPNAQPSLPQSTPELSSVPHSHPLNSQCSLPQSTPGLSSVTHSHPHKTQLVLPQSTLSNCKAPYSNSPNAQLGLPLSTSATSNIPPSQSSSSKSSLTSLLCNAILASPLSAPASSDAPSLQLQSQSSSHLLRPLVPLPEAQSHVNGPTLQNQKAVIPVSVPTTSLHQQNQGQTAFIILPSPAVSNPSQVLSSPFSVVSVTGKTVSMQLSSKVQQASFTRNPQAILTTFAQSVNIQSGHPMFQTPSLAQVQQVQVSSIEAKLAPAHSKGSSLKQPSPQLSFPVPAKQPCLTSHPHTVVSASADPVKAQTEHSQTQSNSFQPSPSALVHQVSPINQPGFMLSPPVASQWVCVAKDPEVSIAASADSLKAHSGHSGTQSNTSPPPPSLLVQQAQVSSVDAKHAESHPTVSPLDQTSSLSSHPKPPQQPSLTKKDLSASMDSGKTYSEHSRTHSSTLDPSPSALGQQAQVSSVDAKHPQCNQTAAPLDQSSPLPVQPKPQQQPSSIKQAPSQGILQKILQGPSAGTQSSRTTCSKSMSLQDPRTIKLITKRLALLKKMSASNKKFSSKVWKFHDCQPYPEPDKTSQPTLSGSIASVSSADGQSPKMLSLTPASLGPQDLKTLNLTANKRRSFKRRPNKKLWKFHLSQPSPDPKQANLSSLNGSASECSSAGLPNPQSENQTLTPQQACCKVPCQDKPSEQKDSQPQLTKDVLKVHSNWLNGLPQSFRDILGVAKVEKQEQDSLQTDCEDADLVQAGDTDSVTSDKGVVEGTDTVEIKNTHPEKVLRCQVDLVRLDIKLPPVGCPLPRFRIGKDGSLNLIHVLDIIEKKRCIDSKDSGSSLHCKVCSTDRASLRCVTCERGFHRDCHVPPITTKVCNYTWKCSLCQDLSDSRDPFRKDRHRKLWLNSMDQRRCEHLILALMCKKSSSVLYNSSKGSKSSVDFESIHERLLRQRSPTYRTPSELVSDIWVLLDSLLSNAEETDDVLKIQKSFEKRVNQVFGSALHPSLLTRPTVKKKGDLVKTGSHSKKDTSSGDSNSDSSDDCTEPVVKKPRLQ